jgi:hypothetical protein
MNRTGFARNIVAGVPASVHDMNLFRDDLEQLEKYFQQHSEEAIKCLADKRCRLSGNLESVTRSEPYIKKENMSLFISLENRNIDSRYTSGDASAICQIRFQGRVLKGGQMPLFSPRASHL